MENPGSVYAIHKGPDQALHRGSYMSAPLVADIEDLT